MNHRREYFSDVTDGRLQPGVTRMIAEDLKTFEGKRVHVTIERKSSRRTLPQNALFHMYVGIIAKDVGYDFDEMKEIIKFKFCQRERVDEKTGEVMPYVMPTSQMTKLDFMELIDRLIRWSAEMFGIRLPSPNEYGVD